MQVLKEPLFYSSIRSGLDGEVENDRELLLQEQKSCRARARKFSLETNRRRKALEERRKQWDVQEQILRENILQQRKQRLQEATERFQRAHLPPSQKRKPGSSKGVINLDEALSHIHGALSSYAYQSSFLSSTSSLSRSGTPSSKPPGGSSGLRNLRAVSPGETYFKLIQERNIGDFKTSQLLFLNQVQEAEPLVNDPEQACIQEHHDAVFSCTESLSSLDSLEPAPEVHQKAHGDNTTCCSSFSLGVTKGQEAKRPSSPKGTLNCPSSNHPPKRFLEEVVSQEGNSSSSPPSAVLRDDDSSDEEESIQDLTRAVEQCNLTEQSQATHTQASSSCQYTQSHLDSAANLGPRTSCYNRTDQRNIARDKGAVVTLCTAQDIVPDTIPLEFSRLIQESNSSLLMESPERKHMKYPPEIDVACRGRKREDLFWLSSGTTPDPNAPSVGNPALQKVPMDGSFQSHKSEPDKDSIIPKREATLESCVEKCKRGEPLDPANESSEGRVTKAAIPKSSSTTEEPERMSVVPVTSGPAPQIGDVRFLKGILKKQSKYVAGNVKFSYRPGHFVFTRQVAMSIRDSMELARAKVREPDISKGTKKKLRWFDEVNGDEGEDEERVKKDLSKLPASKNQLTLPPQQPLADHLQGPYRSAYVHVPTAIPKTSMTSIRPGSTRHAWADCVPQEGRQQEREESRPQRPAPRVAIPRVPRRVRSGHVSSRVRRGTIIRPQSASEARHTIAAQMPMVPRPPPRSEVAEDSSNKTPVNITRTAYDKDTGKQGLASEEEDCKDGPDSQHLPSRNVLQTEEDTSFSPAPASYAYTYETVAKGVYALFQSNAQLGGTRNGPPCGGNGICLDRTPTDEEISLLWHGVRSALASKDGEPRSFLTNGPLSASPQVRANMSHVTINGVKAVTRMGGFFLTPSNMRSPVRRPTVENNLVKSRTYVDHGRIQAAAPADRSKSQFLYQATVPISGCKTDQTVHDEVPLLTERDRQVDTARPQRGQALGPSTLSLEEQRLLQSLDRLNERLHNLQDVTTVNASLKGVFAQDPAHNLSPQPGEVLGGTLSQYHVGSADGRSCSHRLY